MRRVLTIRGNKRPWVRSSDIYSPFGEDELMWVATLELNERQVVGRHKWPVIASIGREVEVRNLALPSTLGVGDFLEVRADRRWRSVSGERRVWYYVVTDIGEMDGLGRPKGPIIIEGSGPNLATPVLQRREGVLALFGMDRSGVMYRARQALRFLNPRERHQLYLEFERQK